MTNFVEGIYFNKPHENAPGFVKAKLKFERDKLIAWLKEQDETIFVDVNESKDGKFYGKVDDWKPTGKKTEPEPISKDDDLPF